MISSQEIPISKACLSLNIGRRSYYNWICNKQRNDTDRNIKSIIGEIALEFPKHGYRRMTYEMRRRGQVINHKKVLRLMREENLLCKPKKRYSVITTNSNHSYPVYQNLAKDIVLTSINQLWVSDITYVHLVTEHVYLAVIIDVQQEMYRLGHWTGELIQG